MFHSYLPIWITTITVVYCVPTGVYVTKDGEVGASWGGYSASAGLGGILSGDAGKGGLHAEAGTPQGHVAAAGVGGSTGGGLYSVAGAPGVGIVSTSNAASSSSSSFEVSGGGGSSASATNAVNKHPHKGNTFFDDIFNIPQSVLKSVNELLNKNAKNNPHVRVSHVGTEGNIKSNSIQATASSTSSSGNTKYDDIFNIPQSALRAVNQFLNNIAH